MLLYFYPLLSSLPLSSCLTPSVRPPLCLRRPRPSQAARRYELVYGCCCKSESDSHITQEEREREGERENERTLEPKGADAEFVGLNADACEMGHDRKSEVFVGQSNPFERRLDPLCEERGLYVAQ